MMELIQVPAVAHSPAVSDISDTSDIPTIAAACIARLSLNTQRAYLAPITSYLAGLRVGELPTRESIQRWLTRRKRGTLPPNADGETLAPASPQSLNIAIAALKLLSRELWVRGILDGNTYNAISDIRSERIKGKRLGHWTDEQGVEKLLSACRDARERALIAIMCGCGLRRAEVAGLRWEQYQTHHGRKVICNVTGKGGRIRSVPAPLWASELIDEYQKELLCEQSETFNRSIHEQD